jgi:ubiquinone/menaquinone biosynthesis C-methylase UbiE
MNLLRVLEPEVMDTAEEAAEYDGMDHSAVNQLFVDDFLKAYPNPKRVLDLGTGTALIPILLCQQHPQVRVVGIDLSHHMLEVGRRHVSAAGLADRIELQVVDAKRLPFDDQQFDAVISNSIIHHIPDPRSVLGESVRVTRPGGYLFFRDLLRPDDEDQWNTLVATYARHESERARQLFADSLRAAFRLDELREMIKLLGYDPESLIATSDRHWTWGAERS